MNKMDDLNWFFPIFLVQTWMVYNETPYEQMDDLNGVFPSFWKQHPYNSQFLLDPPGFLSFPHPPPISTIPGNGLSRIARNPKIPIGSQTLDEGREGGWLLWNVY